MTLSIVVDERPMWDGGSEPELDWRTVDRELRAIATRRCTLDASEARWLRDAERLRIWEQVGMVSALDYMERVLGYSPHAARERLRVANALSELPAIGDAFASGAFPFSAVRELTRVATPATELEWRDAALGKSVHEIEDMVAGHARGSLPSDPPDPEIRTCVVRLELRPDAYARLRQARAALADEHGRHLDDSELVVLLADTALERTSPDAEPTGRAKYQVALTVCERCSQGWQHGAGAKLPVDAATVDQALCDAQHIGSIDAAHPERAHQDVSPSTVRFVWHRDGGHCQTPGCRSSRGLEIHHIVHREDGGTHDPSNLTLRCSACHRSHHLGRLSIRGRAPDQIETIRCDPPNDLAADARSALVEMGWSAAIARSAVAAIASHVGRDATLDVWVRAALRECPRPIT